MDKYLIVNPNKLPMVAPQRPLLALYGRRGVESVAPGRARAAHLRALRTDFATGKVEKVLSSKNRDHHSEASGSTNLSNLKKPPGRAMRKSKPRAIVSDRKQIQMGVSLTLLQAIPSADAINRQAQLFLKTTG